MRGGLAPLGLLAVACPVCRAGVGKRCTTRRGWATQGGAHHQRRAAWLAAERAPTDTGRLVSSAGFYA